MLVLTMTQTRLLNAACIAVLNHAILQCRADNWQRQMSAEQTADLMDAVHNLPSLLAQPGYMSAEAVRKMLEDYDQKWPAELCLCAVFDAAMKR